METSIRLGSQEYEAESHLRISEQCTYSNRLENQVCVNFTELAPSNFLEDHPSSSLTVQMNYYKVLVYN